MDLKDVLQPAIDLAMPGAARKAVRTRSYRKEIIIFTSDKSMGGHASPALCRYTYSPARRLARGSARD